MVEWEILSGKRHCEACETPFGDQQLYHTLLVLENEPWIRKDYCQTCWERDIAVHLSSTKDYATWTGHFKVIVPVPKTEVVGKDHAQVLFRKLLAAKDPTKLNAIFVLAIMLERRKILKQQKVIRKESLSASPRTRILVYTHTETLETIIVEDPQIRLSQWHNIQHEVKELLEQELSPVRQG